MPVEIIARIPSDKDELIIPPEIEQKFATLLNDHPSTPEEISLKLQVFISMKLVIISVNCI